MDIKKTVIIAFFAVLISCDDKHKELLVAEINIETLKTKLSNQKCHNKAIFIFNPACPTCMHYLREEYPIMKKHFLDSVDYFFISSDTISLEKYKDFFHTIGITSGHLFALSEKNPDYLFPDNSISIPKLMQYLFPEEECTYRQGSPLSFMTNKENKIKLEYYLINDSASMAILPQPWHRLDGLNLNKIDFNAIDDNKNKKK